MRKFRIFLAGGLLATSICVAQPPPPHPGGSGNQGAAIPVLMIGAMALAALGTMSKASKS